MMLGWGGGGGGGGRGSAEHPENHMEIGVPNIRLHFALSSGDSVKQFIIGRFWGVEW